MSAFTTQVRYVCEEKYGLKESVGADRINEVVSAVADDIIGEYPIFDESYRNVLNTKILKHYYTREIGEETVGLWRFRLNTKMNEIMPFFNKLYESELIKFNPLYDVELSTVKSGSGEENGEREEDRSKQYTDVKSVEGTENITEDGSRSVESTSKGKESDVRVNEGENKETRSGSVENSRSGNNSGETSGVSATNANSSETKDQLDKYADTPQGSVSGLLNGTYLTNARDVSGTDTKESSGSESSLAKNKGEFDESGSETSSGSVENRMSGSESGNKSSENSGTESEETNRSIGKAENKTHSGTGNESGRTKEKNRVKSTENYVESVMGKNGNVSYSKMLMEFRDTFINIDMMVIDELSTLFIGLWE